MKPFPREKINFTVRRVSRGEIKKFIEENHYSKSINGCVSDYCYAMYRDDGIMLGAVFFGRMAMANQYKRFSSVESEVIELRRLCCTDDAPRNSESYFIGKALRLLKKDWKGKFVVSYADAEYGHCGTIYKASNFIYYGFKSGAKVIEFNGKLYHDKAIRTKHNGTLKPFAVRIKKALEDGEAVYKKTAGKHTFVYTLR